MIYKYVAIIAIVLIVVISSINTSHLPNIEVKNNENTGDIYYGYEVKKRDLGGTAGINGNANNIQKDIIDIPKSSNIKSDVKREKSGQYSGGPKSLASVGSNNGPNSMSAKAPQTNGNEVSRLRCSLQSNISYALLQLLPSEVKEYGSIRRYTVANKCYIYLTEDESQQTITCVIIGKTNNCIMDDKYAVQRCGGLQKFCMNNGACIKLVSGKDDIDLNCVCSGSGYEGQFCEKLIGGTVWKIVGIAMITTSGVLGILLIIGIILVFCWRKSPYSGQYQNINNHSSNDNNSSSKRRKYNRRSSNQGFLSDEDESSSLDSDLDLDEQLKTSRQHYPNLCEDPEVEYIENVKEPEGVPLISDFVVTNSPKTKRK